MSTLPSRVPHQIVLVEDDLGDIRLTETTLKECGLNYCLNVLRNGEDAMAFLRREGRYSDAPRPDLILLDLNLPRKDGREVLAEAKSDPNLRRIPIVVLTTSSASSDIIKSYDLHANSYITKPVELDEFVAIVKSVENYWLRTVQIPKEGK
jgi:two-component system, chemotaxis family, response regulator Rcp1